MRKSLRPIRKNVIKPKLKTEKTTKEIHMWYVSSKTESSAFARAQKKGELWATSPSWGGVKPHPAYPLFIPDTWGRSIRGLLQHSTSL